MLVFLFAGAVAGHPLLTIPSDLDTATPVWHPDGDSAEYVLLRTEFMVCRIPLEDGARHAVGGAAVSCVCRRVSICSAGHENLPLHHRIVESAYLTTDVIFVSAVLSLYLTNVHCLVASYTVSSHAPSSLCI